MTHHITLSVETEWSEAEVIYRLLNIFARRGPDALKIRVLHGPERRAITLDDIARVRDALQIGLEAAEELLARHDTELGRTTRSNRLTAEAMEADVRSLQEAIDLLKS